MLTVAYPNLYDVPTPLCFARAAISIYSRAVARKHRPMLDCRSSCTFSHLHPNPPTHQAPPHCQPPQCPHKNHHPGKDLQMNKSGFIRQQCTPDWISAKRCYPRNSPQHPVAQAKLSDVAYSCNTSLSDTHDRPRGEIHIAR